MNDEPEPSTATRASHYDSADGDAVDAPPTAAQVAEKRKKNRDMYNRKRADLLDDLQSQLDMVIYAELSAIYYMDCLFFQFFLRAFFQLAPQRSSLGFILGITLLCILLHLFRDAPAGSEATRGYLHGGLAMDFIGQAGPTSKILLILLDLLVLVLQIVHMSAHSLREKLRVSIATPLSAPEAVLAAAAAAAAAGNLYPAARAPPVAASQGQSLDEEERGVRRSGEQQEWDAIELQTLNTVGVAVTSGEARDEPGTSEQDPLFASAAARAASEEQMFDAFSSGRIVIADLNLSRVVKEQLVAVRKWTTRSASANFQANRALGERLADYVLRWRFSGEEAPAGRTLGE